MRRFTVLMTWLLMIVMAGTALATALSADRRTPTRSGEVVNLSVAASNTIYAGAMVAVDSNGYAVPASASNTLTVIGRAEKRADNSSGSAGDITIDIGTGVYRYANQSGVGNVSSSDDIGKPVYVVDDQTVSLSSSSGARPFAGVVYEVDSSGVWVDFRRTTADSSLPPGAIPDDAVSLEHLDSGIAPSHIASICNTTASETDADATVTETHASISATDIVVASMVNSAGGAMINATTAYSGSIIFRLTTNGGADTQISYCAHKAAQ